MYNLCRFVFISTLLFSSLLDIGRMVFLLSMVSKEFYYFLFFSFVLPSETPETPLSAFLPTLDKVMSLAPSLLRSTLIPSANKLVDTILSLRQSQLADLGNSFCFMSIVNRTASILNWLSKFVGVSWHSSCFCINDMTTCAIGDSSIASAFCCSKL